MVRAYPRSRGATSARAVLMLSSVGLSPLARGNPLSDHGQYSGVGPIPARAGQPEHQSTAPASPWAYPRSRGATCPALAWGRQAWGLSPLARGNLCRAARRVQRTGPIPARAGQPALYALGATCLRAYPRSRGATCSRKPHATSPQGLSPLARGNRWLGCCVELCAGPIPARAGQPPGAACVCRSRRAYPRSRGATV